jgi:CheY-like chemotaxis protein
MNRLLWFEDDKFASDNKLFAARVREGLPSPGADLVQASTVGEFETLMRNGVFSVIVLDIMAILPHADATAGARAGIKLLERCRSGAYGPEHKVAIIYMRTARGELHIREAAQRAGCNGYFAAGTEDGSLIRTISEALRP